MQFGSTIYRDASPDMQARFPDLGHGKRLDGTNKGGGFATFQNSDGSYSSELSAGHPGIENPSEMEPPAMFRPLIYENIPPWEVELIKAAMNIDYPVMKNGRRVGWEGGVNNFEPGLEDVERNSYIQAAIRQGQGKSPFFELGVDVMPASHDAWERRR